jgi:CHAT domain-containing protein
MAAEVQEFRSALQNPGSAAWQEGAKALHERLWQPIESSMGVPKVIVVAHGALHYLPFGTLMGPDSKLLIDQYSLRFLPSASVLKYLKPPAKKDGLLLALGNPDLGDPRLDLRFAEDEARQVAKLSPQARLLVRKDASETNLKKAGGAFSRIHFATHGKFQPDEPLASGLYLSKDAENDGVLTVGELYSMQLDTDLVTLSACETGLGKVANGDDVVGLTRGFLYAGSRSIVASLWSVDDKATATLMETFYDNITSQSKQDALRNAQLKTREAFPHPFFWAAFQLTGRAD